MCLPQRKLILVRGRSRQIKAAEDLVAVNHGDGEQLLSSEQADAVLWHSERLRQLDRAKLLVQSLGDAVGASLANTMDTVIHSEVKRFRRRICEDTVVADQMRKTLAAEEAMFARKRHEFQQHMQAVQDRKRAAKELKEVEMQMKKARKEQREALEVAKSIEAVKTYTLKDLGQGRTRPPAGGEQFRKARSEVLQRVRRVSDLSPMQTGDWDYFRTEWDRVMADRHGENWATIFAEIIQNIMNEVEKGNRGALSELMHAETNRVLQEVPVLQVRGVSVRTQPLK